MDVKRNEKKNPFRNENQAKNKYNRLLCNFSITSTQRKRKRNIFFLWMNAKTSRKLKTHHSTHFDNEEYPSDDVLLLRIWEHLTHNNCLSIRIFALSQSFIFPEVSILICATRAHRRSDILHFQNESNCAA